ncbi:MAG: cyclic nucleotide-binding domain-containing protein [Chloroflexota bacterium]
MAVDLPDRVAFLKRIHIFRGLNDAQLTIVAEELREENRPAGDIVISQGDDGDYFYLIHSGKARVTRQSEHQERELATLIPGDYFGEEALLTRRKRSATVETLEDTRLLVLSREDLSELLKKNPKLRANFEVAVESRQLIRQKRFKWVRKGEVIYFLARKHPIVLYQSMIGPVLLLIIPLAFLLLYLLTAATSFIVFFGLALLVCLGWGIWQWLDWGNDYYIVTNQRVIWLEKVIAVYDTRQEAPLSTILSVGVETDQLGRILDYGDVVVRTFVGRILFHRVHHPFQAASLVEEHWTRTRESSRKVDSSAMKEAIRSKLGLPSKQVVEPEPQATVSSIYKPGILRALFANMFKVRTEDSGVITYRKHPFVLFQQTWKAGLAFLLLLAGLVYRLANLPPDLPGAIAGGVDTLSLLIGFFMLGAILWWIYQFIDYRNDIFQVTQDQIFDIDRTPLGREERKAAPLDNILSTEYKRIGFLQVVLNFGHVYITVGGAQLVFENVADPPAVQQDIDQRRITRIEDKRRSEAAAERERMADWIATYHRSAEGFQREEDLFNPEESDVK